MKQSLAVAAVALALAFGASGAFAFSTVTSNNNLDDKASARVADPDDLMDNMANQQSNPHTGSATIMRFGGSSSLQFQLAPSSNSDVGVESRFIQSPGANLVPSQRR